MSDKDTDNNIDNEIADTEEISEQSQAEDIGDIPEFEKQFNNQAKELIDSPAHHFKSGNKLWERRDTSGRAKKFESPDQLESLCIDYFEWVEANPLWQYKIAQYKGVPVPMKVPKMQAMTIHGLCLKLGITHQTWINYASAEGYEDFFEVCAWAESVMRVQKFTGAAADLLNPAIIARDLGLVDKQELTGANGSPLGAMVQYEIVGGPGVEPPIDAAE